MKLFVLAFVPSLLCAQTVTLHVTGSIQSAKTSAANFGHLPSVYRAADWTVENESGSSVKIALPLILAKVAPSLPGGISILSPISNGSVVADAQGSSLAGKLQRGATATIGTVAGGVAMKIIPVTGAGAYVIFGAEAVAIVAQYVFPALQSHALQSITGMLPSVLSLDSWGSVSGMVIVERSGSAFPTGNLSQDVTVQTGASSMTAVKNADGSITVTGPSK